ncbi:MAG: phosphoribosylglycinamide formyltransferase [Rhodospirillales bacterium]|nr:phosphoribosylglycinamide formyltransferase [Rhodospirillales bacterium]
MRILLRVGALLALGALSGCGLVAAPCRVTAAGFKIVPVVGPVAAATPDACANAIDPTPTRS